MKKEFEEPKVTKVEIDFNDRVVAAGCIFDAMEKCVDVLADS